MLLIKVMKLTDRYIMFKKKYLIHELTYKITCENKRKRRKNKR